MWSSISLVIEQPFFVYGKNISPAIGTEAASSLEENLYRSREGGFNNQMQSDPPDNLIKLVKSYVKF